MAGLVSPSAYEDTPSALTARVQARADAADRPGPANTWAPVDLGPVLSGENPEPVPSMLARVDGRCLLYPGRLHGFHAEPEALKSWIAQLACAERLRAGERVAYFDFEDFAANVVQRLRDLGVKPDAIAAGFVYVRPDEPLTERSMADLNAIIALEPTLAIIDGVTEAFSRQGLSPLDNSDVAAWLDLLPRRLARGGAATVELDHVVKDRENRGRYAIGAQHKLAGVDVAYSLRVVEPFGRGRDGVVAIKVSKDRPGRIREYAVDGQVAIVRAHSEPDGGVSIVLERPEQAAGGFRPTHLMQKVSLAVEERPGLPKRSIREHVRGKTAASDLALELLVAEGYVEARRDGSAHRHYPLRPYREADDDTQRDPVTQARPKRDLVTGEVERDPVTPPIRGHGHGHGQNGHGEMPDRDPLTDDDLERAERIIAEHADLLEEGR